ncbi:hypothetical protein F4811DRAFT_553735 [Daldinia bambusicola]|nr:hypothetical protein F4811DRAFT_553735 [Daldinia bambusicola]
MYASAVAIVSTLAASVAAAPNVAAREVYATWPANNFEMKCFHPGGCTASFDINAPAGYTKDAPAFNVICHPLSAKQDGKPNCEPVRDMPEGSYVDSIWEEASTFDGVKVTVFHVWNEGETRYNASGSAEFPSDTKGFMVQVTSLTAVL